MRHRQLPEDLKQRVRRFGQYKWLATKGVDEESILRGLPADLRRDIQRHLCLDLVRRVWSFYIRSYLQAIVQFNCFQFSVLMCLLCILHLIL